MKGFAIWCSIALLSVIADFDAFAAVPMSAAGDGHDTVPVYVDGKGPYPFILDSGADSSAVYSWFAEQQHLKKTNKTEELSGQTGSGTMDLYEIGDLALDSHHIRHVSAYGLPNRHDAGREAGILGNDFMDGTLVAYDFPCRRIEVHVTPVKISKVIGIGPAPVQAAIDEGTTLLTLPVTINGFTGIAALDTGSRNTRLTSSFAIAAGIDAQSSQFHDGEAIFGANSNKMIPRNGLLGNVSFGGMEIGDAHGQVIDLPMLEHDFGGKPAMLLGADLLNRYRLLYDHEALKIWLRDSRCHA
jgi:predicted aspartyl protease